MSDRMRKADVFGWAIAAEASAEAEITAYQSAEDAEAKLARLVKLVTEIKLLPTPERLTAIKIMNEFVQSEADLANSSSAGTKERSPSMSIDLKDSLNPNQTQGNAEDSNQTPFAVTVIQNVEMPLTSNNTVTHNEHPPIEWVKDKGGVSWNIDSQDGDTLIGHRAGLRGSQEIKIDDCADIHYKTKTEEVEA